MSISPQGYTLGGDPQNINPFWGEDEQTNWTIEAEATVDNTSGSPSVNVETDTDTTLKKKTFKFEFSGLKGADGTNGVGITSIAKTGTSGLVDTYTITFTNGTTTTFTVTNGTSGTDGDDGVGISSIQKTGTSGLVDTYTITLTNGETDTFTVTNGSNGTTPVITITATEGGTPITVTKTGTDAAPSFNFAFTGGGGGGSTVSVTQIQSTGTKIATITVDGVGTDLYAPEGGSGGSGTIEGDATVKWAGKALTSQPSTYPYKRTVATTYTAGNGTAQATGRYLFTDPNTQQGRYVNITITVSYDVLAGTRNSVTVYQNTGISGNDERGSGSAYVSFDSATADISGIDTFSGFNNFQTNISGGNLYSFWPSSIEFYYNGMQVQASYSGDIMRFLVASGVATVSTTYDVMEAVGIGLVINSNDFSDIVGKVVNKLRCTFENAAYYIHQIPTVKVQGGTVASIQITAGAGILYFDNFEFNAVSNTVWGQGMLRVVVPNSGGEYDFQGLIGLQCTDANSIVLTLGRGTLTHSGGDMYITTGTSSAFTVNSSTSTVSAVYAEVI